MFPKIFKQDSDPREGRHICEFFYERRLIDNWLNICQCSTISRGPQNYRHLPEHTNNDKENSNKTLYEIFKMNSSDTNTMQCCTSQSVYILRSSPDTQQQELRGRQTVLSTSESPDIYYLKTKGGGALGNSRCGKNDGIQRTEIGRHVGQTKGGGQSVSILVGGTHPPVDPIP